MFDIYASIGSRFGIDPFMRRRMMMLEAMDCDPLLARRLMPQVLCPGALDPFGCDFDPFGCDGPPILELMLRSRMGESDARRRLPDDVDAVDPRRRAGRVERDLDDDVDPRWDGDSGKGRTPGQWPGQTPGQWPGQTPGQLPGQHPGKDPGQWPGQHGGRVPGQWPGEGPSKGSWRVERGDTLNTIGDSTNRTWRQLFGYNRDQLTHPDLIHPGQVLRIPGPDYDPPPYTYHPRSSRHDSPAPPPPHRAKDWDWDSPAPPPPHRAKDWDSDRLRFPSRGGRDYTGDFIERA